MQLKFLTGCASKIWKVFEWRTPHIDNVLWILSYTGATSNGWPCEECSNTRAKKDQPFSQRADGSIWQLCWTQYKCQILHGLGVRSCTEPCRYLQELGMDKPVDYFYNYPTISAKQHRSPQESSTIQEGSTACKTNSRLSLRILSNSEKQPRQYLHTTDMRSLYSSKINSQKIAKLAYLTCSPSK